MSLTLRLETLSARSDSLESFPFSAFLEAFGAAGGFFPAEAELELAHHFAFAKLEPFA